MSPFNSKVQCLIIEGHCLAVPDNEVVRESSGLLRVLCTHRITRIGREPRRRGQQGETNVRDVMVQLPNEQDFFPQNGKRLCTVRIIKDPLL